MSSQLAENGGNNPPIEKMAYKLVEAALALGLSTVTIRRLVARGELRPVRTVRHLLFAKGELLRFLEDNR